MSQHRQMNLSKTTNKSSRNTMKGGRPMYTWKIVTKNKYGTLVNGLDSQQALGTISIQQHQQKQQKYSVITGLTVLIWRTRERRTGTITVQNLVQTITTKEKKDKTVQIYLFYHLQTLKESVIVVENQDIKVHSAE